MGINITHTMSSFQFENKENLRNTARSILNKQGATQEATQKILEKTLFSENTYYSPQLAIIKASSQVTLNNSLKETLKYLKTQAVKKVVKKPVFGELWDTFNNKTESHYEGELIDYIIDSNKKNIFAA